ncbi:MAG: hypothetical protein R3B92_03790 [Patescibacteria group bacterium]|uniref:Uncharacterized protein n=1 Tax=candidate division WWE3 bacterium TaxID=2053526 RepID=A0A955EBD3_UNCKA|nr:hypothetical protein [candidate division WWE3 bacterium]
MSLNKSANKIQRRKKQLQKVQSAVAPVSNVKHLKNSITTEQVMTPTVKNEHAYLAQDLAKTLITAVIFIALIIYINYLNYQYQDLLKLFSTLSNLFK